MTRTTTLVSTSLTLTKGPHSLYPYCYSSVLCSVVTTVISHHTLPPPRRRLPDSTFTGYFHLPLLQDGHPLFLVLCSPLSHSSYLDVTNRYGQPVLTWCQHSLNCPDHKIFNTSRVFLSLKVKEIFLVFWTVETRPLVCTVVTRPQFLVFKRGFDRVPSRSSYRPRNLILI